jgi:hypothetical protein
LMYVLASCFMVAWRFLTTAYMYDVVLRRHNSPSFDQLGIIRFSMAYHSRWKWALSFLGEGLFLRSDSCVLGWNFIAGRYVWGPGNGVWLSQVYMFKLRHAPLSFSC